MATLLGATQRGLGSTGTYGNPKLVDALDNYELHYWPPYICDTTVIPVLQGERSRGRNYDKSRSRACDKLAHSYRWDFYYRVHIIPYIFNFGTILVDVIKIYYIWNANFFTETLSDISYTGQIDLITNITFPVDLKQRRELIGEVTAPMLGVPVIKGNVYYVFVSQTHNIPATGLRAALWPFIPQVGYIESRQWQTDIVSVPNTETRYAVRDVPRTSLSYTYVFRTQKEYANAKRIGQLLAHVKVGLPSWIDNYKLTNVLAGDVTLPIDTVNGEFLVGQLALLWQDSNNYEVLEILEIHDSYLKFVTNVLNNYDIAWLIPIKLGYINGEIQLSLNDNHSQKCQISITAYDTFVENSYSFSETFKGLPILNLEPILSGGLKDSYKREQVAVDNSTAQPIRFNLENYNRATKNVRLVAYNKIELNNLRRMFDYFQGKLNLCWLPSYFADLVSVNSTLAQGSANIVVTGGNWVLYGIKNIYIICDTNYAAEVESVEDNNDGTETLTLKDTLPHTLYNVNRISIMEKMRLNTDTIEFNHITKDTSFVNFELIQVL